MKAEMIYGGIDGCKFGWILMKAFREKIEFGGLYASIQSLVELNPDLDRILIDIPIGLSSRKSIRTVDSLLKKELKERHSTVFNAPSRESLLAKSHKEASQINREIEGKGLSIQTYYISDKIDQLDTLLSRQSDLRDTFIESHPEICFKYLNGGEIVLSKKSTKEGIKERLEILQRHYSNASNLFHKIIQETSRKQLKRDDILDALCLCLANILSGKKKMRFIHDPLIEDGNGIKMRIGYFKK
jgi:8-oxo-dGTP diphosphatase